MKILLLSNNKFLYDCLSIKEDVTQTMDRIYLDDLKGIDWIISYGYRHMISSEILKQVRAINLHISFLPWNRGADPNLWSFIDDTPKGVTVHYINEKLDKGDIIFQSLISFREDDTLATTYNKLNAMLVFNFLALWSRIKTGTVVGRPQKERGSYHCVSDKEKYAAMLTEGWNTPIKNIKKELLK